MTMTRITGTQHPLLRRAQADARAVQEFRSLAAAMWQDQQERGLSQQGIYHLSSQSPTQLLWRRVGDWEDSRHLLSDGPAYVAVGDSPEGPRGLAVRIARQTYPDRYVGTAARAQECAQAAEEAAPTVAVLLSARLLRGDLEWDTDESVSDAGRRLALDAGWELHRSQIPVRTTARHVVEHVAGLLDVDDVASAAAEYLAQRTQLGELLAEQRITWGGDTLSAEQAAARAGLAASSWRAEVSRDRAPVADVDGRWRPATVDAWRATRGRLW